MISSLLTVMFSVALLELAVAVLCVVAIVAAWLRGRRR